MRRFHGTSCGRLHRAEAASTLRRDGDVLAVDRALDPEELVATMERLERRIRERLPDAHLTLFAGEIVEMVREAAERSTSLARPIHLLRLLVWVVILGALTVLGYALWDVRADWASDNLGDVLQSMEATISSAFFMGAAAVFLFTLEQRIKRRRAQAAMHELRGLAHVIDMHQLDKMPKDPSLVVYDTFSSPKSELSNYELSRYLDYCSELLAIVNKMGALYVRHLDDPDALAGVDGLQHLIDGLQQKIWQKMNLVDRHMAASARVQ